MTRLRSKRVICHKVKATLDYRMELMEAMKETLLHSHRGGIVRTDRFIALSTEPRGVNMSYKDTCSPSQNHCKSKIARPRLHCISENIIPFT